MGLSNGEHAVDSEKGNTPENEVVAGNKINGKLEQISNGYVHYLHSDSQISNGENRVDEDIQDSDNGVFQAPEDLLKREEEELSEIEMEKSEVEDIVVNDSETKRLLEIENFAPEIRENHDITVEKDIRGHEGIEQPLVQLPKPEAPPGVSISTTPLPYNEDDSNKLIRSQSLTENFNVDMPAIGKFIRERSNSISAAIAKRLSSLKDSGDFDDSKMNSVDSEVTEFNISGLKVIVKLNKEDEKLKGRISFFSRSNCRDCTAVRTFFRERGLKFVEINVDVYPQREKELIDRKGNSQVPQIFFNEKLFGGLVALNSLRDSGVFEHRLREMLEKKCPDSAPAPPVYGFDDPDEESADEMVAIVRVLRQKLPIQDRLMKMKIVKNCFAGAELVEVLIHHLDCGRRKAVDIGKQIARKHFIHHVFGQNDFEDGNHFYRFLEHEPFIPKCYNFRGFTNDSEPKPASMVGQSLTKIMAAILESYASDNRCHVDYTSISKSEEFRRYVNLTQDLQRLKLLELSSDEKLAFFLNLHNAMVIHAVIRIGRPEGVNDSRSFFSDFQYIVGGYPYSLNTIKNGILRSNRRAPYSLVKPFGTGDRRLEIALPKVNPLIHFGLCNGTRSSPIVRFFTPQGIEPELRYAARDFFQRSRMEVDLGKRTVHLTRIIKC
ncbi:uncharacterized protein LOC119989280 isoform X2 [Tripterygium wilfordii]|uniref:uncharacterized protein LOC119989280 isoform X2 n=1 Tax=Tripterygium wilfordii TaxID=458696 RepID=UPI0018F8193E|nr:uncharacterized protein LOC119989280 isoform X2 [Tripterygium wilfordii]